ncbi:MAG: hypothetical protein KBC48_02035 [Candidatus Pacebacteria bacterium]|nr:hypothetical protein [Candidatus Paceibacterota bacterium]
MVKLIIVIILVVLALSYFHIDLRGIIESPSGQANFNYVWELAVSGWQSFMQFVSNIWPK